MHCSSSDFGYRSVVFHHITFCIDQIELVPALARCRSTLTCISDLYYAVAVRRPSVPFQLAAVCTSVPWSSHGVCVSTRTVAAWLPAHTALRDGTSCCYQMHYMHQCNIWSFDFHRTTAISYHYFLEHCQCTLTWALQKSWLLDFAVSSPCPVEEARPPPATTSITSMSTPCILSTKRRRHTTG